MESEGNDSAIGEPTAEQEIQPAEAAGSSPSSAPIEAVEVYGGSQPPADPKPSVSPVPKGVPERKGINSSAVKFLAAAVVIVLIVLFFYAQSKSSPSIFLGGAMKQDVKGLAQQISRPHSPDENIFPLMAGNEWDYDYQTSADEGAITSSAPLTVKVVKVSETADGTIGELEFTQNGVVTDRQTWLVNSKGLFALTEGKTGTKFDPMQPVVTFPIVPTSVFNWKGTGQMPDGTPGPMTTRSDVAQPVMADTSMGQLASIPVDSTTQFKINGKPAVSKSTMFFQRKVGLVRYKMTVFYQGHSQTILIKLRSHTLNT